MVKYNFVRTERGDILCPLAPTNKGCLRFSDDEILNMTHAEMEMAFDVEIVRILRTIETKRKETMHRLSLLRVDLRNK